MKKKIVYLFSLLFVFYSASAQGDFQEKFEKGRNFMEEFRFEKAAPIFEELHRRDSSNMNITYLLGVCYTMGPVFDNHAIHFFEKAKHKMNEDYDSKSSTEKSVPIHVFYYLAVAYAQSFNFAEANNANERFRELIGTVNGKYLRDAEPLIQGMMDLKSLLNEPVENEDSFSWGEDGGNGEIIDGGSGSTDDLGNYGVQIGAFAQSIPSYIFSGTENVKAYRGPNGLVRFVVGSVETREEAERIRDRLRSTGYADAFLVRLNKAEFMQEVR